jgi:hypothetical protein
LLGSDKNLSGKKSGNDYVMDLSSLKPDELSSGIFLVKLEEAL